MRSHQESRAPAGGEMGTSGDHRGICEESRQSSKLTGGTPVKIGAYARCIGHHGTLAAISSNQCSVTNSFSLGQGFLGLVPLVFSQHLSVLQGLPPYSLKAYRTGLAQLVLAWPCALNHRISESLNHRIVFTDHLALGHDLGHDDVSPLST